MICIIHFMVAPTCFQTGALCKGRTACCYYLLLELTVTLFPNLIPGHNVIFKKKKKSENSRRGVLYGLRFTRTVNFPKCATLIVIKKKLKMLRKICDFNRNFHSTMLYVRFVTSITVFNWKL